ncbi:hypothetical protein NL494_28750, partial [Klebsiella pneumoniae]|nr:hypothetical protein [Klebsiella pneumoniae]
FKDNCCIILYKRHIDGHYTFVGMKLRYRKASQPPQLIHLQATHLYCAPTLLAVRCDTPEHVMVSYDELKV